MKTESLQILFKLLNKFQKDYYPNDDFLQLRFSTIRYLIREQITQRSSKN